MKNVICTFASILILSSIFISCSKESNPVTPTEKQFSAETISAIDNAITEALRETNSPGFIVGIWSQDGNYVKAAGVSNLVTGEPMKPENHFRMGSITKTFVGTVVLKLVDEGKLSLDTSLASLLPEYPFPQADKITVRMLGNMTSGIFNYTDDPNWSSDFINDNFNTNFSADSLLKISLKHSLYFEPGTQYKYSNTNTVLLGLICKKVTGMSIDKLLEEKIFIPYDLKNTYWPHNVYLQSPYSNGYTRYNYAKNLQDATNYNVTWADAAGILVSNIYDLKKWIKLLGTGGLYSSATHVERLKSAIGSNNGYGFCIAKMVDDKFLGHDGAVFGFSSWAYYYQPKDMSIIISANFSLPGTPPVDILSEKIVTILLPELLDKISSQKKLYKGILD
jgi:D-alanyl-D-alanine carboxypeptidase